MVDYPWYELIRGLELEQGDLLQDCMRLVLKPELASHLDESEVAGPYTWEKSTGVIISQSCDLAQGRLHDVLFCGVYTPEDTFPDSTSKQRRDRLENIRRGREPGYHLLNKCALPGVEHDFLLVDCCDVFSLPLDFVRAKAERDGPRARLLPPYREHLSQAFARFFMRVGLPADIPPFR